MKPALYSGLVKLAENETEPKEKILKKLKSFDLEKIQLVPNDEKNLKLHEELRDAKLTENETEQTLLSPSYIFTSLIISYKACKYIYKDLNKDSK